MFSKEFLFLFPIEKFFLQGSIRSYNSAFLSTYLPSHLNDPECDQSQTVFNIQTTDLIEYSFDEYLAERLDIILDVAALSFNQALSKGNNDQIRTYFGTNWKLFFKSNSKLLSRLPLCHQKLINFQNYVESKIGGIKDMELSHSYLLNDLNNNRIEKLFDLLTEENFVHSTMDEFRNAFTGKGIKQGIRWLTVSPKTKKFTQVPMLYFIKKLADNNLIDRKDYYSQDVVLKKIVYVFRKPDGEKFQPKTLALQKVR